MRTVYLRLALSCLGVLLASLIATTTISVGVGQRVYLQRLSAVPGLQFDQAVRLYETEGPAALAKYLAHVDAVFESTHLLLDATGRDLASGQDRSDLLAKAQPPRVVQWALWGLISHRLFGPQPGLQKSEGPYRYVMIVPSLWIDPLRELPYQVALLVVLAFLYSLIAFRIVSPLKTLKQKVDAFGAGDLDARVNLARKDEIGDLAQAFDAMADRMAKLLAAQRRLLQDVSHELRSPLARLAFALELVKTSRDRHSAVETAKQQLRSLETLTASLLDFVRLEGNAPAEPAERVSLAALVNTVVKGCALEAGGRNCRFRVVGGSTCRIYGDRVQLTRAFDNIIRNAVQFSPAHGVIEILMHDRMTEAVISVRDYGPGVPDEALPHIFEPFFRVDSSRSRSTGGVGLGLAIARSIAEAHGGHVIAENARPGLKVTITLASEHVTAAQVLPPVAVSASEGVQPAAKTS